MSAWYLILEQRGEEISRWGPSDSITDLFNEAGFNSMVGQDRLRKSSVSPMSAKYTTGSGNTYYLLQVP